MTPVKTVFLYSTAPVPPGLALRAIWAVAWTAVVLSAFDIAMKLNARNASIHTHPLDQAVTARDIIATFYFDSFGVGRPLGQALVIGLMVVTSIFFLRLRDARRGQAAPAIFIGWVSILVNCLIPLRLWHGFVIHF